MCKFWLALMLVFLFVQTASASVWINEISPSTDPEWIELYNDGSTEINLTDWLIEDGNSSHTDDLSLSGTIGPLGYLVFSHKEGWLNNSGDTVKLYNNASPSAIVDQYIYESVSSDKTVARVPSGSESWQLSTPTQGLANPTPVPSPTQSPSPTPTPSPTLSPSPKPSPLPSPTPKPTPSPSTIIVLASPQTGTVAGETTEIDLSGFGVSPTPNLPLDGFDKLSTKPTLNHSRARTAMIVGSGLLIMSAVGYFGYRKYLSQKSLTDL